MPLYHPFHNPSSGQDTKTMTVHRPEVGVFYTTKREGVRRDPVRVEDLRGRNGNGRLNGEPSRDKPSSLRGIRGFPLRDSPTLSLHLDPGQGSPLDPS